MQRLNSSRPAPCTFPHHHTPRRTIRTALTTLRSEPSPRDGCEIQPKQQTFQGSPRERHKARKPIRCQPVARAHIVMPTRGRRNATTEAARKGNECGEAAPGDPSYLPGMPTWHLPEWMHDVASSLGNPIMICELHLSGPVMIGWKASGLHAHFWHPIYRLPTAVAPRSSPCMARLP
jgi:hypothetical protein